ncbi:MAG: hypothetical protein U0176_16965 [Bacteroidia bacterium]
MGTGLDQPRCASSGITVWPGSGTTILPNQQFMVEGYSQDQEIAERMCSTYKAYLKSETETVSLELVEVCLGQFRLSQAVLKPTRPLREGVEYKLVVEGLRTGQSIEHYDYETGKYLPRTWTVSGAADELAPIWIGAPKELGKHYDMYGCGPGLGVEFGVSCTEMKDLRVKTQIRPIGGETWTSYYLVAPEGKIDIGHGMCSGEFTLHEGKTFEAKFSLVDPAGNVTPWSKGDIRFDRPGEMDH